MSSEFDSVTCDICGAREEYKLKSDISDLWRMVPVKRARAPGTYLDEYVICPDCDLEDLAESDLGIGDDPLYRAGDDGE